MDEQSTETTSVAVPEGAAELVYGHYKGVHIGEFVKDIVLFGQGRVLEVCNAHNVDDKLFAEIIEIPAFKKEMREIRALTEASPNALIQLRARCIVESGLMDLQRVVKYGARDTDKIQAMKLLAQIGGITAAESDKGGNDGRPVASGLVLNVQLGANGAGLVPPVAEARTALRDVSKFMPEGVIDVVADK